MSDFLARKINHYKKALLIKPDNAEVYSQLAEYYYNRGQFTESATACETALKIQPNLVSASKTLALVLQEQGQVDAAFELYNNLGDRLVKEEKLEAAIIAYQSAIELKPDAYPTYYSLGEVLQQQSNFEESVFCYIKALGFEPLLNTAYYKLNSILNLIFFEDPDLFQEKNIKSSILESVVYCYRQAIQAQPEFSLAYVSLGNALTIEGKLEEAISYYQTASYKQLTQSHPEFVKSYWDIKSPSQPNFLIIGVMKGGTTSLYSYLVHHPRILPAIEKEILFFGAKKFKLSMDWYLAHFPPIPDQCQFFTGEATPWYYLINEVEKVADFFPKLKLILILRNPIDRAFSHYQMILKGGRDNRGFSKAVTSEIQHLQNLPCLDELDSNFWRKEKGYLLQSLYVYFIEKWMAVFPREQFLILKSEDFYGNPAATLTQVFEFLGVPDYPLPEYRNYNPGSYNPISDDLRQRLADFFRPHNQKLEEYLGMTFNWD
jgi:tetratricopeptide (TPR) repeat protein